jgi:hypothetical protein
LPSFATDHFRKTSLAVIHRGNWDKDFESSVRENQLFITSLTPKGYKVIILTVCFQHVIFSQDKELYYHL